MYSYTIILFDCSSSMLEEFSNKNSNVDRSIDTTFKKSKFKEAKNQLIDWLKEKYFRE